MNSFLVRSVSCRYFFLNPFSSDLSLFSYSLFILKSLSEKSRVVLRLSCSSCSSSTCGKTQQKKRNTLHEKINKIFGWGNDDDDLSTATKGSSNFWIYFDIWPVLSIQTNPYQALLGEVKRTIREDIIWEDVIFNSGLCLLIHLVLLSINNFPNNVMLPLFWSWGPFLSCGVLRSVHWQKPFLGPSPPERP